MRTVSTRTVVTALEEVDDAFFVVGEAVGVEAFADGRVSWGCALCVGRGLLQSNIETSVAPSRA